MVVGKMVITSADLGISALSAICNAREWVDCLLRPYARAKLVGPSKTFAAPVKTRRPCSPRNLLAKWADKRAL